jgi:hypothetical protein
MKELQRADELVMELRKLCMEVQERFPDIPRRFTDLDGAISLVLHIACNAQNRSRMTLESVVPVGVYVNGRKLPFHTRDPHLSEQELRALTAFLRSFNRWLHARIRSMQKIRSIRCRIPRSCTKLRSLICRHLKEAERYEVLANL